MGNVAPCLVGGPVVKVMLPDCTVKKYDHAVQVAELASMYPNYAVAHCSTAKPSLGQLRAVIIMKMDEYLVPGHAYILYPIPQTFNDSFNISVTDYESQQDPPSDTEVSGEIKTKMGSGRMESGRGPESGRGVGSGRRLEEPLTAEELERSLSLTLMGPARGRQVPRGDLCLLDLEKEEYEKKEKQEKQEKKVETDPELEPIAWTPDLYQISED